MIPLLIFLHIHTYLIDCCLFFKFFRLFLDNSVAELVIGYTLLEHYIFSVKLGTSNSVAIQPVFLFHFILLLLDITSFVVVFKVVGVVGLLFWL